MKRVGILLVAVCALLSVNANAQTWPSQPINLIVPFGPGSGTDAVSRIVAQHLQTALGQNVVVENKATHVARSAPDGYTLLMSTNSPHSAAPFLNKSIAYDAIKDFAPITRVGSFTLLLIVNADVPAKSVSELIAYVRANPGKLSFASGNTSGVVAGETLKYWGKLDMVHVPYKSVPPAITDLLAGRVSMMFADLTTALPHVRAGKVRALAASRKERSKLFPDVPSLHEAGVTDFEMDSWAGLLAPANTPKEVVDRLNTEVRKIIENPEIKQKIGAIGFEAFGSTPDGFAAFIKLQLDKWGRMVRDAGIQPEG
jgi:tripartite-type tricarboxylate transporter receptor subunit TctC